jgi:hypothetical protein
MDSVGKVFADYIEYIYTLLNNKTQNSIIRRCIHPPSSSLVSAYTRLRRRFVCHLKVKESYSPAPRRRGQNMPDCGVGYAIYHTSCGRDGDLEANWRNLLPFLMNGEAFDNGDRKVQIITLE